MATVIAKKCYQSPKNTIRVKKKTSRRGLCVWRHKYTGECRKKKNWSPLLLSVIEILIFDQF
jgi:hypothetical protein